MPKQPTSKKVTKSTSKKKVLTDYGTRYEFKGVKYWIYKRTINRPGKKPYEGIYYHTKFTIKGQSEIRVSTNQKDFKLAQAKVLEMILECSFKVDNGQIVKSRKFKDVSKDFLLDVANNPKTIPSKIKKFTSVVDNFFDPFFGEYPMETINEKTIYEYKKWRRNYWKIQKDIQYTYVRNGQIITSNKNYLKDKPLSLSSMQKEDSILRQILELGRLSGDISSNKVVKVKSESFKTNRRPSFTNAE
jgi:hypothetical protein